MKEMRNGSLSSPAAAGLFWTIFGAGVVMIILGPILDKIMAEFNLSQTRAGVLSSSYAIGSIGGMMMSSIVWPSFHPRRILSLATFFSAVFLLIFSFSVNYLMAFLSFLVVGGMNGLIFTYSTTLMSNCGPRGKRASAINYLYSAFGGGVIVGPSAAQLILNLTGDWRPVLYVPVVIMAVAAVWVARLGDFFTFVGGGGEATLEVAVGDSLSDCEEGVSEGKPGMSEGVVGRPLLSLFLALALYVGAEASVNVWVVKYFTDIHSLLNAGYILTFIWIAISGGRFLLGRLLPPSQSEKVVITMAGASSIFLLLGAMVDLMPLAAALYIMVGLSFAGIYPLLISLISSVATSNQGFVLSAATSIGSLGAIFCPPLIGALSEYLGFREAMGSIVIFTIGVIAVLRIGSGLKRA